MLLNAGYFLLSFPSSRSVSLFVHSGDSELRNCCMIRKEYRMSKNNMDDGKYFENGLATVSEMQRYSTRSSTISFVTISKSLRIILSVANENSNKQKAAFLQIADVFFDILLFRSNVLFFLSKVMQRRG